jgi:hypothetical protein
VELALTSPEAKQHFAALEARRDEFSRTLDLPLHWHNPPERKQCRIYVRTEMDFTNRQNWPACFVWLQQYLQCFADVFGPVVKSL